MESPPKILDWREILRSSNALLALFEERLGHKISGQSRQDLHRLADTILDSEDPMLQMFVSCACYEANVSDVLQFVFALAAIARVRDAAALIVAALERKSS
jgi:hypothetical protein